MENCRRHGSPAGKASVSGSPPSDYETGKPSKIAKDRSFEHSQSSAGTARKGESKEGMGEIQDLKTQDSRPESLGGVAPGQARGMGD